MKIQREKNIDIIKNNTRKITPMMTKSGALRQKKLQRKNCKRHCFQIVGDEQRKMKSVSVLA